VKSKWFLYTIVCILLSACVPEATPEPARIERHPGPPAWVDRGALAVMPAYDPARTDAFQVDLRGYDLSALDLRNSLPDLQQAVFDDHTVWPPAERMPPEFYWQRLMELGRNPGLGLRDLHKAGLTGEGVSIAIVDQPLLVDHQEYVDRLKLYEEINVTAGTPAAMHGAAVASIAVGKTVGVAPLADLYYIGSWTGDFGVGDSDFTFNFAYYAQAVRRILAINKELPAQRRIRAIAMQIGWSPDQKGYADIAAAVNEARAAGVFVISSSLETVYGFKFHGLGRDPMVDPDRFESYLPGSWWAEAYFAAPFSDRLLVPMDARTTASPTGNGDYVFYRRGGWSWVTPYLAGMYALACQVDPTVTPERFWRLAMQTGRTIQIEHAGKLYSLGPILDPVRLLEGLKENLGE
jgi:subtilisin family serine protease